MPDRSKYSYIKKVATIDVGTNTALLLVSEWKNDALHVLAEKTRFVHLGAGVDRTGMIAHAALLRLESTLREYRNTARNLGANIVAIAGTSASRDASNRVALEELVFRVSGVSYEILAGEEEALWSFVGSVSGLSSVKNGTCTVIDVGGGSTELISGRVPVSSEGIAAIDLCYSLDVGSVRVTERCFATIPPSSKDLLSATKWIESDLGCLDLAASKGSAVVGAAGTAAALGMVHSGARAWSDVEDGRVYLSAAEVADWSTRLLKLTPQQTLALSPIHLGGREDVFAAGVLILDRCLEKLDAGGLLITPRGLRHGLAIRYFCQTAG